MLQLNDEICSYKDAELVAQTREGNQDAFGLLISRHQRMCVKIASFILRDRGDAQDEVQKACCKAFEHLDQYHGDAEFLSWLLRIVSNQCLMLIRVRRRTRFLYIDAESDREKSVPIELPSAAADPERQLIDHEMREVLRREIRRIPPLLRNVLLLRDVQELPMPEVAARLRITVPAAKSRLLRARAELRERIQRHCAIRLPDKAHSNLAKTPMSPPQAPRALRIPPGMEGCRQLASAKPNASAPAQASGRRDFAA
jgi:RNA polymerase sigma-70 factor (ECF subfamily)